MHDENDSPRNHLAGTSLSAATRLLEKRKEMLQIQSALQEKRLEFKERLKKIKMRERSLAEERNELTEHIIELDKFIKENEINQARHEKTRIAERKAREKLEQDGVRLLKEIKEDEKEREQKKSKLENEMIKFQKFLQDVVSLRGDDNPEEVDKIITRFNDISYTHDKLMEEKEKLVEKVKDKQKKYKEYTERVTNEIVTYNNSISDLKRLLNDKKLETSRMQKFYENTRKNAAETKVMLGQIEMACQNLFNRAKSGSLIPRVLKSDSDKDIDETMEMLKVIEDCIHDFNFIVQNPEYIEAVKKLEDA